jgi:hypothetical protein
MPPAKRPPDQPAAPVSTADLPAHQDTVMGVLQQDPGQDWSSPATLGRTTQATSPGPGQGSGETPSGADSSGGGNETKTATTGRSRTSFNSAAIQDLTRTLVGGSASLAHDRFARSDEAQAAELWLTTDAQDAAIGDPLANIAARRISLTKLADSKDAEDIIQLVAATAGYLTQQLRKLQTILRERRLRKQKLVAAPVETVDPEGAA